MRFLLMIVEPKDGRERFDAETLHRMYGEMVAYGASMGEQLLATESLRPEAHGVRLSAAPGKPALRDGPFTEAREMVGGFFLIDVASRDEALALARRCPAMDWAEVEVRECAPCHV